MYCNMLVNIVSSIYYKISDDVSTYNMFDNGTVLFNAASLPQIVTNLCLKSAICAAATLALHHSLLKTNN